jgi:hypothetical protein
LVFEKFPFCKIPFHPSEDNDALISELPWLSAQLIVISRVGNSQGVSCLSYVSVGYINIIVYRLPYFA